MAVRESKMGNTKNFMSEAQRNLAAQVLNRLVPTHDGLPGAGDVGVVKYLDCSGGASLPLRRILTDLLSAIEAISQTDYAASFGSLSIDRKTGVLQQIESANGPGFTELLRRTYAGYYSEPIVLDALGIDARPPQPRGYSLAPFDTAILERVRKRDQAYRDA
jgi:hypothetical protein